MTIWAISPGANRQLTATGTALSLPNANETSKNSGPFLSRNATRSPGTTPAAANVWASRLERVSSSPNVIVRPSNSSAGSSGRSRPCTRTMPAIEMIVIPAPRDLVLHHHGPDRDQTVAQEANGSRELATTHMEKYWADAP